MTDSIPNMMLPMDQWGPLENAEYFRVLEELEDRTLIDQSRIEDENNAEELGCKKCGAPPSPLSYGYCSNCEGDELEAYIADAMETEADFQSSRQ